MELRFKVCCVALLSVVVISMSRANGFDSLRVEKHRGEKVIIHQVEQGETLYSLARRYHTSVQDILALNAVENNQIGLGQLLNIPFVKQKKSGKKTDENQKEDTEPIIEEVKQTVTQEPVVEEVPEEHITDSQKQKSTPKTHTVQPSETLFSLSRKYGVTVGQIREWNSLESNNLSIGQELIVAKEGGTSEVETPVSNQENTETVKPTQTTSVVPKVKPGYQQYYVQSGDRIETIAQKYNVRPDSVIIWNGLSNSYLAIGQVLLIKGELDSLYLMTEEKVEHTGYSDIRKVQDASGYVKVFEEGIAKQIEGDLETTKYLAMHRTLKPGTMVEIRNLMNNRKIFVRIVGILPDTGLNEKTLIRLTPICFKKLGIIDPKTIVEISYYED